jgi:hypothetical protein
LRNNNWAGPKRLVVASTVFSEKSAWDHAENES